MKRSTALQKPSFWHSFNPSIAELLLLNKKYSDLLDVASTHQVNQSLFDTKWDKLNCYSGQSNAMLQREFQELQDEKTRIRNEDFLLTGKIEYLVRQIYNDFNEMVLDMSFEDRELSDTKFSEFLLCFKQVIESGNNLPCYKLKPFAEIVAAINIYHPGSKN